MLRSWISSARAMLDYPKKIFIICALVAFFGLLFDGTFIRLWSLSQQQKRLRDQISQLKIQNSQLNVQLEKAKDPAYISRMARDRLDLVGDDELIFVFDDD